MFGFLKSSGEWERVQISGDKSQITSDLHGLKVQSTYWEAVFSVGSDLLKPSDKISFVKLSEQ